MGHASFYYAGTGVPQDFNKAAYWFRAAAERGQPNAQNDLAVLYSLGQGVPVDYDKAAHWARLAAEQGLVPAQSNLAFLYEHGWGVPLDYVSAFAWYSRASRAGDHAAAERLASLRQIMTSTQLDRATVLLASQTPVPDLASSAPALAFGSVEPIK